MREMRRRDFIRTSLSLAGTAALAGCSTLESVFGPDSGTYDDEVLIVGAGLAGLAAAQEFKRRQIPYRVIEASARVGGRVRTLQQFNDDGQFAELGAEFVDSRHDQVLALCRELSLPLDPVEENAAGAAFWFRDRVYSRAEVGRAVQPVLTRLIRERLRITGDLENPQSAFVAGVSPEARALDELSFEDLLARSATGASALGMEYLRRAALTQFGVESHRQSCLHFLMALDPENAGEGVRRVRGGTEALTRALYERVAGVLPEFFVRFQTSLVSVHPRGSYYECRVRTPQGLRSLRAQNVLFAVPPAALRAVDGFRELPLDGAVKEAVAGWSMASHSKTVLSFRERFWSAKGEGPGLASLTGQFASQAVWDSSRGQTGKSGVLTFTTSGAPGAALGADAPKQALKDAALIWKRAASFADDRSAVRNWSQVERLGGSVTLFEPGKFSRWNGVFENPGGDGRIAFAGEHASASHMGTMEGAVASGRRAAAQLAKNLGRPARA